MTLLAVRHRVLPYTLALERLFGSVENLLRQDVAESIFENALVSSVLPGQAKSEPDNVMPQEWGPEFNCAPHGSPVKPRHVVERKFLEHV